MKTAGFLLVLLGLSASPAFAFDWFVNSTRDRVDVSPGDRVCFTGFHNADGTPECTLRAAVQEANMVGYATSGAWIHLPAGEFRLDLTVPAGEDEELRFILSEWDVHGSAQYGDLDLSGGVRITGAGQDVTIVNAVNIDRVFDLWPSGVRQVTLEQFTIAHGFTHQSAGGCLNNRSFRNNVALYQITFDNCTAYLAVGGAVFNAGYLQAGRVRFQNNNSSRGGGLHNAGIAEINESTFVGNGAETSHELGQGRGGAIANYSTHGEEARLTLLNSTLMGNLAPWGAAILNEHHASIRNTTISGNIGQRGAIANLAGGQVGLTHVTLTANVGAGVFQQPPSSARTSATASILSNNRDQAGTLLNCYGLTLGFSTYSIEDGDTCGMSGEGDRVMTEPMLAPLADNLGPTLTHALLEGSPAIDAMPRRFEPRDQRDFPRLEFSPADAGAYEFGAEELGLTIVIPVRWRDLFRGPVVPGKYSLDGSLLQRRSLKRAAYSAQIIGVKPSGQNSLQYWLGAANTELRIQGSVAPPTKGAREDGQNPELFSIVLRPGTGLPDTLRLAGSCDCSDKGAKQLRVKIPSYDTKQ